MTRILPLLALVALVAAPAFANDQPPAPSPAPRPQVSQTPLSVQALKPGRHTIEDCIEGE